MNQFVKGLIIGYILGFLFHSEHEVKAKNLETYGERGSVEWKPIYVKIVD